ncbi:MAG: hypothetical protein Edafosvirus5_13 [Edafosvirus sp.]|uniref:Uncharacterized protein n=1 Tax=Edafosvirus sp. TaxID=2487765 RepID=A0A3G4ZT85_9VIRU|nr:MAG: hypothetical protein Edafosvirus5_13 [Edafosvirus sp.]
MNSKNLSPKELGMELENMIHQKFSSYGIECYTERDIINLYGIDITGIDHMLKYFDKIVLIQDKWTNKPPSIDRVNHFIKCVDTLKPKLVYTDIKIIYLSKRKPSKPSIKSLDDKNYEYIYNNINGSMHDLVLKLESNLMSYFQINISGKNVFNKDEKYITILKLKLKNMINEAEKEIQLRNEEIKATDNVPFERQVKILGMLDKIYTLKKKIESMIGKKLLESDC